MCAHGFALFKFTASHKNVLVRFGFSTPKALEKIKNYFFLLPAPLFTKVEG